MRTVDTNSLINSSVGELIESMYQLVSDIPEEISPTEFMGMSNLLMKLPNDYAFANEMLAHSRYLVRHFKREKKQKEYEDMMDKRDALENIASVIKLKYQAVSRVISLYEMTTDYNSLHQSRLGGQNIE